MTAPAINLISKKKDRFDKQAALSARVKVWSGIGLVIYGGLLAAVLVVVGVLSFRIEGVTKSLDRAKLDLASQALVIQKYEAVYGRLSSIKTLFAEKREVIDLWTNVRAMLPLGCELTGFRFEEKTLNVTVTAPHVLVANELVDRVELGLEDMGIEKTDLSLSRGMDASYRISMVMTLMNAVPQEKEEK
jgi:hypothetical protein